MQHDRREIREVDEAGFVVAQWEGDLAARAARRSEPYALDPVRHTLGHLLFEERSRRRCRSG